MREVKIGLMGGTFNPVHNGHLLLAEQAKEQYRLDHVVFLPAGKPPHKQEKEILPDSLRLRLTRIAVRDNPDFSVSSIEFVDQKVNYTAETLEKLANCPSLLLQGNDSDALKKLLGLPDVQIRFYFIIGGDSLLQFASWKTPEKILSHAVILASGRSGITNSRRRMEEEAASLRSRFGGKIGLVELPEVAISSTDIRKKLDCHQSVRYLVPEDVRVVLLQHMYCNQETGEK